MSKEKYFSRKLDPDSPNGPRDIDIPEMLMGVMRKRSLLVFAYFKNHPEVDPEVLFNLQFDGWVNKKRHFWDRESCEELLKSYYREVWGAEDVNVSEPPGRDESFSRENVESALDYIEKNGGRGDLETKYIEWKNSSGKDSHFFIPGLKLK